MIVLILFASFLCISCVSAEDIAEDSSQSQDLETAPSEETVAQSEESQVNSSAEGSVYLILDNDADKENVHIGDYVTWIVSVINTANVTAKNVQVHDELPEGLKYVSHTTTKGTFNPETGIWYIGELSLSDGEVFLNITTIVVTLGEKINKATLTTDSINLNNETSEEEEIDVVEEDDDSDSSKSLKVLHPSGNPLVLILLSLLGIFSTIVFKSKN